MALRLNLEDRRSIRNKDAGLIEPSGLALARDGGGFWTVSDNKRRLFYLRFDGRTAPNRTIKLPDRGMEGVTSHPNEDAVFLVREPRNEVLRVDARSGAVTNRRRLADMVGYEAVAGFFDDGEKNKGLEGIAWNSDTGTLFCLKEAKPGLLMEVTPDLMVIRLHARLDADNGFTNSDGDQERPDFSGISFDPSRSAFWIVSDKARRLYLYDPLGDRVVDSVALAYRQGGKTRRIRKAEGVVCDPRTRRLHVVSDRSARLYTFEIKET
ncbi:MAG: hypothetical protein GY798_26065 [Hyphomicrobiales bacterium]|nr:hypothetical protein [Hyphomicrobiales bacterium]